MSRFSEASTRKLIALGILKQKTDGTLSSSQLDIPASDRGWNALHPQD